MGSIFASALRSWAGKEKDPNDEARRRVDAMTPGLREGTLRVPFRTVDREAYLSQVRGKGIAARTHKAPAVKVPIAELTGIQRSVNRERIQQHLENPGLIPKGTQGSGHGGLIDLPIVVRKGGVMHVHDGHHRTCVAIARGDDHVTARVIDLDAEEV